MIRLVSKNEWLYTFSQFVLSLNGAAPAAATTLRWQPVSARILAVFPMPFNGLVTGLVMRPAVIATLGNSVDIKCMYRVKNGGSDLAGAGIGGASISVTEDLVPFDAAAGILSPVNQKMIAFGKSGQAVNNIGDLMYIDYTETGTIGTAVRPIMIPVGIVGVAIGNISPLNIGNRIG